MAKGKQSKKTQPKRKPRRGNLRRAGEEITIGFAVLVGFGLTMSMSIFAAEPTAQPQPQTPPTKQSSLKVDGFGSNPPKGVGKQLQGGNSPVKQSGDIDKALQNPQETDEIQPNAEEENVQDTKEN